MCTALAVTFLLFMTVTCFSLNSRADDKNTINSNVPSVINISTTDEQRYTLIAEQAKLSDIMLELGKTADFKFKTFVQLNDEKENWNFNSVPLSQLLTNLLRDYNTVMLYEESQDKKLQVANRRLKELWLIASENQTAINEKSIVNIEIELEQSSVLGTDQQALTPEQQQEISYINNLEGLTSDDVIESLKSTLMTEEDPIIRKRAVAALGDIGGTRVLSALEAGLGDSSAVVRAELAKSFAGIKHQGSMLALGQLLVGDKDAMVRKEAIRALYQQDSPAARSFVEAAQKDKDDSVKQVANEILQQWVMPTENE